MCSLQPLVLLLNFSGVNFSKVLSRRSALPGNGETEQPSKRPVAESEWKPSSPLSEWPVLLWQHKHQLPLTMTWGSGSSQGFPSQHGNSHSACSHCLCLGTHYPAAGTPWESEFPVQDEPCGGHQGFRRFSATAFWSEWLTIASFWGFNSEVLKGVNCDFEMLLTGAPHRMEAAFSAAVHESVPKTHSK